MSDEHLDRVAYEVVGLAQLTDEQAEQARALRDMCNRADGLDLKLGISTTSDTQSTEPYAFLCTLDDTLVGFCTLEGGDDPELELCGMVHPAYRRRGIGRALLRAALDSARRRIAAIRVLVICEDASVAGRAFVAAAGAKHSFSENRMETTTPPPAHATPARLDVRPAEPSDAPDLARTISASFGQADDHMADEIFRDMTVGGERYFLARLGALTRWRIQGLCRQAESLYLCLRRAARISAAWLRTRNPRRYSAAALCRGLGSGGAGSRRR